MKPYRDVFGNPLSKKDVAAACQALAILDADTTIKLSRACHWGIGKASRIMQLLEDAGVVNTNAAGSRSVTLRTYAAAVNAANRQLRKGKRG